MEFQEAKQLKKGQLIYERGELEWKVNRKVKLWKRQPNKIEIRLKLGTYVYCTINEKNLSFFSLNKGGI